MIIINPLHSSGPNAGVARVPRFLTASLARELGILLALSVLFPFLMHLLPIPESARLAARLLPMFYAPLLAALWGRKRSALIVAVAAPWLNLALTSHPTASIALVMMVQLVVFVGALRILLFLVGARWFLAAPAFVAGLAASVLLTAIFPGLVGGQPALSWAAQSAALGLPGIAALVLINWLVLVYYPPDGAGGGLTAA